MKTLPLVSIIPQTIAIAVVCVFLSISLSGAEEAKAPEAATMPEIEQLDEFRYRIGEVTFDKKTREIHIPGLVNMREGLLEFLIVHEHGAVHESLLRTKASPTHINLALILLGYKPSKELYRIPTEKGTPSDKFYEVPEETKRAARLDILVEFEKDGELKRLPASDWVRHETSAKSMPPSKWVYGGSDVYKGKYVPESSGQIAAIFITDTAIINYPGDDNMNDDVWAPMTAFLPDLETKVTIVLAPHTEQ